jgi:hypothetical protein
MIVNEDEVREFLNKNAIVSGRSNGTVVFTNGNEMYIKTLIANLLVSYERKKKGDVKYPNICVFCSDEKGYKAASELGMNTCMVNIPSLEVDDKYEAANAGSEFYLRLCFVKIVLIKYALNLGYDVLYIDPDMVFNKDCMNELVEIKDDLTFAKYVYRGRYVFVNSNIMRVYPTDVNKRVFDFVISRDLERYIKLLPDVGDETFIQHRLIYLGDVGKCVKMEEYPAGGDTKHLNPDLIKMYHANCMVGLVNKINYFKENGVWWL